MLLFFIRHGDPIYDPDGLTELGSKQAEALSLRLAKFGIDEIYSSTSNRAVLTATPTAKLLNKEIKLCDWAHENYAWQDLTVDISDGDKYWCKYIKESDIRPDFPEVRIKRTWCWNHLGTAIKFNSPEIRDMKEDWANHEWFKDTSFSKGINRIKKCSDEFMLGLGFKHNRETASYELLKPSGKRVALFAHQGFGLAFLSSILDIPYPMFSTHFDFGHSSMTVIEFNENNPIVFARVLQLSNDSHLYKEDILTGYQNSIKF